MIGYIETTYRVRAVGVPYLWLVLVPCWFLRGWTSLAPSLRPLRSHEDQWSSPAPGGRGVGIGGRG